MQESEEKALPVESKRRVDEKMAGHRFKFLGGIHQRQNSGGTYMIQISRTPRQKQQPIRVQG